MKRASLLIASLALGVSVLSGCVPQSAQTQLDQLDQKAGHLDRAVANADSSANNQEGAPQ